MNTEESKNRLNLSSKSDQLEKILQEQLQRLVTTRHIHHAVAAIESMDGSFKWSGTAGIAYPDETPMTIDTPFWIASITKLFTAAAILKLHEQEQVSIEQPMATYLPGKLIHGLHRFKGVDYTENITLQNLLGHSSGLPDYIEIHRRDEKSLFDKILAAGDLSWTLEDLISIVRDVNSSFFPPQASEAKNKKVRYSDTNYQLLIAILEAVTGKPLHEIFDEMFYKPLGLKKTFHPGKSPAGVVPPAATLWYKETPLNIPQAMASFKDPFSTVDDLLIFMRALLRGDLFNDPATVKLMHTEWNRFGFSISPVGPGWPIEYGLGMMRMLVPRFLTPIRPFPAFFGHTGATGTWLFYCAQLDLLLAGDVSQITAGPVPFQFVPKILRALMPFAK
jgi:D-alanyl-D-alanine carboxypeptidase